MAVVHVLYVHICMYLIFFCLFFLAICNQLISLFEVKLGVDIGCVLMVWCRSVVCRVCF